MNKLLVLISIPIFFLFTDTANCSDWEKFIKAKEDYYYLDKQNFNNISCNIDVPLMNNLMSQIESQAEPIKSNIILKENLRDFEIIFQKNSGLRFVKPIFTFQLIAEKDIADPSKVRKGIKMMEDGFQDQVDGVVMTLTGVFDTYTFPQKEQYNNINVLEENNAITASYSKAGSETVETIFGKTIKGIQKFGESSFTYKADFENIFGNKLLLSNLNGTLIQPIGAVKTAIFIKYGQIDEIIFPTTIKSIFDTRNTINSAKRAT